jgi:hypothetical protein
MVPDATTPTLTAIFVFASKSDSSASVCPLHCMLSLMMGKFLLRTRGGKVVVLFTLKLLTPIQVVRVRIQLS